MLESSGNHHDPAPSVENSLPRKWFLVLKRLGLVIQEVFVPGPSQGQWKQWLFGQCAREPKRHPLRTFQGVVRPHLFCILLIPVCTISI